MKKLVLFVIGMIQFWGVSIGQELSQKINDKQQYRNKQAQKADQIVKRRNAQMGITVDLTLSATELIQDVFITGGCFDVENIEFDGVDLAKGKFSNGMSSIGIDEGIILTSGRAENVVGPNESNARSSNHGTNSYDPDLFTLVDGATNKIKDQAILEFDFTPTSDQISFEYAFASEEYCEFAGDEYNDIFGFFISGPGINGTFQNNAKNLAVLPNTNTAVSINTINHFTNEEYYVPNELPFNAAFCGKPSEAVALNTIEFDGFTTLLTASTSVIPCETYHIRMTIADGEDGIYDSAVFLKANSFNAGGTATAAAQSDITNSNVVFETCDDAYFIFERTSEELDEPIEINFELSPLSTATENVDFEALPNSVTIPSGAMQVILPVMILPDAIIEGEESLIIQIDNACSCTISDTELIITEIPEIELLETDFNSCQNENILIDPLILSNDYPLEYIWSDGSVSQDIELMAIEDETISVTVTDVCGNTKSAAYDIHVSELPTAEMNGEVSICENNESQFITINLTGNAPWNIGINKDGVLQNTIEVTTPVYEYEVDSEGIYTIANIENEACVGESSGSATVQVSEIRANDIVEVANCTNNGLGQIILSVDGAYEPFTVNWNNSSTDFINQNLPPETYQVTITDGLGCTQIQAYTVENQIEYPIIALNEPDMLTCVNTTSNIEGFVENDTLYNTYVWSSPDGNILSGEHSLSIVTNEIGTYYLTVENSDNGCISIDSITVNQDITPPQGELMDDGMLTCVKTNALIQAVNLQSENLDFRWFDVYGNQIAETNAPTLFVTEAGMYALELMDLDNGCDNQLIHEVLEDTEPPIVTAGEDQELTCSTTEVFLEAIVNSTESVNINWLKDEQTMESENEPIYETSEAGLYTFIATQIENGCTASENILVTENTNYPTFIAANSIDPLCKGDMGSIEFSEIEGGEAPYIYSIDGGNNFYNVNNFESLQAGAYDLVVQDMNGCEFNTLFTLPEGNQPDLNLEPSVTLELGDNYTLQPQTNILPNQIDSIRWFPSTGLSCDTCLNPTILAMNNSAYELTIMDQNGCQASANIIFQIIDEDRVFIPNAFSPLNNDAVNDIFQLYSKENYVQEIITMKIYDRWGNQVFESNNFEPNSRIGWDGRFRNQNLQTGVYVYYFEVRLLNGSIRQYSGDVTLMN